jgi:hypothetical protein
MKQLMQQVAGVFDILKIGRENARRLFRLGN